MTTRASANIDGDGVTVRTQAVHARQRRLLYPLLLPRWPGLPAGWPLAALFVGYPVWWALGLRTFIFPLLAVPMAVELLRRRPLKVPPGFGLWLLFLVWLVASATMLGYHPPGTYGDGLDASRLLAVAFRLAQYASVTIAMLYVGNLSERELPRARIVRILGALFLVTVAGGLAALIWPRLDFTSPTELLLPGWISSNSFVQSMVHPSMSQVSEILGFTVPRPTAPFGFTNTWGEMLNLLLPWFVVGWITWGGSRRQIPALLVLCVAVLPAIYSLNRGLWIGIGLTVLYFCVRLAAKGRLWAIGALGLTLAGGSLVFAASPLHTIIESRLDNPHSNDVRTFTTIQTIQATLHSPILGYGTTRDPRGTADSIAIDESASCPSCGSPPLGSNGQIWLVLISQGYVGAGLYASFFVVAVLRYRRDPTPIGTAGILVLLLSFFYMLIYNAVVVPLSVQLISLAILWRNDMARRSERMDGESESTRQRQPTAEVTR